MGPKKKNKKAKKKAKPAPAIALTGSGFKGLELLQWLEHDDRFPRVIYLNNNKPKITLRKTKFYRIDLTETLADVKIAEILSKENVKTLIHTALPVTPPRNISRAHELISVGSMYLCNAAAAAKVKKLILSSTADVYGAFPDNPNYLTETHAARGGENSKFIADKLDAENYFLRFGKNNPGTVVSILRPVSILGPKIRSFKTEYLSRWFVPTVLGFDPMVQFIHEDDLLTAFKTVILEDHSGIFNLASRGVIPLSRAIHLMGNTSLPLPMVGLKSFIQMLWYLDISPAPANRLDYLKYLSCVATDRATREMKFIPQYHCKEAIMDFVGAQRLREVQLQKGAVV